MLLLDPSLKFWCWFFLALYTVLMVGLGFLGMKKVHSGDDFATARNSYGPYFLSFALIAATASGGTFIGIPALSYEAGFSVLWYAFSYPIGVFLGFFFAIRAIRKSGAQFGTRSIPEYLGHRFDSEALRLVVSLFSLLLLFYLAAQLLAAALMFQKMLGLSLFSSLGVSSLLLMLYITAGGAHGDILTDAFQGALMVVLALVVAYLFFTGSGVQGGFGGMLQKLASSDKNLMSSLHPTNPYVDSVWKIVAIVIAHMPIGLLPHIGNKFWALKRSEDQNKLFIFSFILAMILPCVVFGGILVRAQLGTALYEGGFSPNDAIPVLFTQVFPSWFAALVIAGILSAVMSTADGLMVSISQIFANDIFRLSLADRFFSHKTAEEQDQMALLISRVGTVATVLVGGWIAWSDQNNNIAILMWNGVGGLTAANAGPLFLGILWPRATKQGAFAGFVCGALSFIVLKMEMIPRSLFEGSFLEVPATWVLAQGENPFTCSTLGAFASFSALLLVSLMTKAPCEHHLKKVLAHSPRV